jgi:DNA-binding response OmpR family regulator
MSVGFSFEVIPIADIPAGARALPAEPSRAVVLIVDDERVIADTLAAVLQRSGFAAITAYDGNSALDLAAVIPPQLLITDISMPAMNGVQLARSVVHAINDCKVLLFSGHAAHSDLIEARKVGYHFPVLTKPVHPSQMLQRILESLNLPQPEASRLSPPTLRGD